MPRTNAETLGTERRKMLILEMALSGARYDQIQRALVQANYPKISTNRIGRILKEMLTEARQRRVDLAETLFDMKVAQLDSIIQSNWTVITAPCTRCQGKGHMGQDPDKGPGTMLTCDKCKGGTKQFPARDRAAASKEVRQAIAEQCKLLGFYAPEKFALTDSDGNDILRDELASMDLDSLDAEWARLEEARQASEREREGTYGSAAAD